MCVALSAHASRAAPLLASGAQDGSVCLWDSGSGGRLLQRLEAHESGGSGWVMALVLARHEDGRSSRLLTASYDHTVGVWVRVADDVGGSAMASSSQASGMGGGSSRGGGRGLIAESGGLGGGGSGGGWCQQCVLKGHTDGVLAIELSSDKVRPGQRRLAPPDCFWLLLIASDRF